MDDLTQISGIPLYIQIREKILGKIKNKEIENGEKLDTEEELAREFGVSRMTVRQALADLVNEGLLLRKRGIGTFVVSPRMTRHYSQLKSLFEEAVEQGLHPSSRMISIEVIPSSVELAEKLKIDPGSDITRVKRLRLLDGKPVAIHVAHVPLSVYPRLSEVNLEVESLYHLYEKNNMPVVYARQRIQARMADDEQADLLWLERNAPILYLESTTYTRGDTPIEWTQGYYASGAPFAIEITLYRGKKPGNERND